MGSASGDRVLDMTMAQGPYFNMDDDLPMGLRQWALDAEGHIGLDWIVSMNRTPDI